jgi:hypothetical protein
MPDPVITPAERLRAVVVAVGSRARLSVLLGYPSDNSLRQAEQGNTHAARRCARLGRALRSISPGPLCQTPPVTGRG